MIPTSSSLATETVAYAAYLNARHTMFDSPDDQEAFLEDLVKARRAMEIAWLNHHHAKS